MDDTLKQSKQAIRDFMRANYTDERLAMLLAHARDGKLAFMSCCCFIGIPTADHALRRAGVPGEGEHYRAAEMLPGAAAAETAYMYLGVGDKVMDAARRRRLIPIIRAEMRRRERERDACVERENAHAASPSVDGES